MERATLVSSAIVTSILKHNELQPSDVPMYYYRYGNHWTSGKNEIVQIVVFGNSVVQFEAFMIPTVLFDPRGSAKKGLSMDNGRLFRHGIELPTVSSLEAVGHNIVRFDAPKICKWLWQYELEGELYEMLYEICDTLSILSQGKVGSFNKLSETYLTTPT
ncbi:hypothetical protein FQA39_LY13129 [Lamprigera yunnana]|nr:hypothetical protein FQA39_LY13129 [Lamprigera yunnana]